MTSGECVMLCMRAVLLHAFLQRMFVQGAAPAQYVAQHVFVALAQFNDDVA